MYTDDIQQGLITSTPSLLVMRSGLPRAQDSSAIYFSSAVLVVSTLDSIASRVVIIGERG